MNINVNLLGTELFQDLVSLVKNVIEDDRVPMEVKDQAYDKLIRITDKARVIANSNK